MLSKKGFTLVELLVVIAIIGILSSVAIVNLNSAREKAKAANVQSTLGQITTAAIVCQDDGFDLLYNGTDDCDGTALAIPDDTTAVCTGSTASWPTLEPGWVYDDSCDSVLATPSWAFSACEGTAPGTCTAGKRRIDCDETGCSTDTNP